MTPVPEVLPAPPSLRIASSGAGSGRIAGLESFGSVSVTADATVLALAPGTRLSAVFAHLEEAGIPASAVQLARPDLEDLFLHLTGKSLRDA